MEQASVVLVSADVQHPGRITVRGQCSLDLMNPTFTVPAPTIQINTTLKRSADLPVIAVQRIDLKVNPDRSVYRLSSGFGYRSDPFTGRTKRHTGVDFALPPGNPIYVTGDGVVESVKFEFFGYGNHVVIDHGFGYKTRYAHLKSIGVVEGMKVKRGECIGESGNSGRSSGPHLHYEVLYKDRPVNPANYYDLNITTEEFATMVQNTADASERITMHPSHRRRTNRRS